ncbi:hypothetical protein J1N35_034247 [Gossypium stocksii]|uniref:Uncharacterized protein n=1 Tax=Gossypium stocksii TaxID=47602 RepID=A0A9D3ZQC4_9ROSI|nr:hypothetical protein J1N35_034247 [Gossypium stocksii]
MHGDRKRRPADSTEVDVAARVEAAAERGKLGFLFSERVRQGVNRAGGHFGARLAKGVRPQASDTLTRHMGVHKLGCTVAPLCSLSCNKNRAKTFKKTNFARSRVSTSFNAPLLQGDKASGFNLLRCIFRETRLVALTCSAVSLGRQGWWLRPTSLYLQGDKAGGFNLLRCIFRVTRLVVSTYSTVSSGRQGWWFQLASLYLQGDKVRHNL